MDEPYSKSRFNAVKHGKSNSRLYKIWANMKSRCNNKNDKRYKYYGAVGVRVCSEWNKSFESFAKWALKSGYKDNLEIDKDINSSKYYSPETCVWVDHIENSQYRKYSVLPSTGERWISKENNKFRGKRTIRGKLYRTKCMNSIEEAKKELERIVNEQ